MDDTLICIRIIFDGRQSPPYFHFSNKFCRVGSAHQLAGSGCYGAPVRRNNLKAFSEVCYLCHSTWIRQNHI